MLKAQGKQGYDVDDVEETASPTNKGGGLSLGIGESLGIGNPKSL